MTKFYEFIDKLKLELESSPFVNTVTYGDISDVDLNKQTIFPLSHFIVNSFVTQENIVTFNCSLMCMDIVDESKEATTDEFKGNDNEQDVFNTQMNVITKVVCVFKRGDLHRLGYQIDGDPTAEAFVDRFENKLAGWTVTFDINVINDISIC